MAWAFPYSKLKRKKKKEKQTWQPSVMSRGLSIVCKENHSHNAWLTLQTTEEKKKKKKTKERCSEEVRGPHLTCSRLHFVM